MNKHQALAARSTAALAGWLTVLSAFAIAASRPAEAACRAESGPHTATLVELYTSEGCDSCPPADRWLSTLGETAGIVPLAFHVDYWDQLGWRDRFASPAFTQRQKERTASSGARFVYTPQVVVGGRDFTAWRHQTAAGLPRPGPAAARISLGAELGNDGVLRVKLTARLTPPAQPPGATPVAYLAVFENGVVSDVRSGENAGARLTHDFVVREWLGPFAFDADGRLDRQHELRPAESGIAVDRAGLAAVVEVAGGGRTLQALRLPLCR